MKDIKLKTGERKTTVSREKVREAVEKAYKSKVIVAGSIITDMSVKVNKHPQVGETIIGNELKYSPGGKGANQAVAAARLDANVTMIGMVGDDEFGKGSLEFMREENIKCNIGESYNSTTGIAMIVVDSKTGNNNIVVIPGANMNLKPENVDNITYRQGDVLVSQFEIPLPTIKRFFHKGRHANCINILNPAPAILNKKVEEILKLTDVLIVNETEIEFLVGHGLNHNLDEGEFLVEHIKCIRKISNIPIIIVTLGKFGAYGYFGDYYIRVKGLDVESVDTTGAGDCFVGAIASKFSSTKISCLAELGEAMKYANCAAAISVTRQGSGISMPIIDEVEMVMEDPHYFKKVKS